MDLGAARRPRGRAARRLRRARHGQAGELLRLGPMAARTLPQDVRGRRRPLGLARGAEWWGVLGAFGLTWVLLAGYGLHALVDLGGRGLDPFFQKWVNDAIVLLAAGLCLWRGLRVRDERVVWLLMSLGMASWVAGN